MERRDPLRAAIAIAAVTMVACTPPRSSGPSPTATTRPTGTPGPNVIVVVTDDQTAGTLQLMPNVRALAGRGMSFRHAFVSNPLCCPSRASIMTGLTSGHTGVWTNGDHDRRWGGWSSFRHNGLDGEGAAFAGTGDNAGRTIALALERAGYRTGLFGKYLNQYRLPSGEAPPLPVGWTDWFSFVGKNGAYYDYTMSDGEEVRRYGSAPRDYSTDVIGRAARTFLRSPDIQDGTSPFFLFLTPFAPHGSMVVGPQDVHVRAPVPFESPAFNEADVSDKPPFVRHTRPISPARHERFTSAWDRAYGTLRDVDRWVGRLQRALPATVRERTIIVFTSDNGFAWGDHRLTFKGYPYERTIAVPLIIAGPGVRHGTNDSIVSNIDIAPTLYALTGVAPLGPMDGASLAPALRRRVRIRTGGVLLEHLSMRLAPSYCGLRTARWKYVTYRGGQEELYDLRHDPYELTNIVHERPLVREELRARTFAACDPLPPDWNEEFGT
jgi:arylsulfatase A-like enzyme